MPADSMRDAQSELGRVVAQGFVLFNEGKIEEARRIAEQGVKENPSLTTAISLKGMCHERRDELAEALECYEKVLAIQPDSVLDRIKVNQLRNAIAMKVTASEEAVVKPNQRRALALSALAVVCFAGIGFLINALMHPARLDTVASLTPIETGSPSIQGFETQQPQAKPQQISTGGQAQQAPGATPAVRPEGANDEQAPSFKSASPVRTSAQIGSNTSTAPSIPELEVKPDSALTGSIKSTGSAVLPDADPKAATPQTKPEPKAEPVKTDEAKDEDPGVIEIQVTRAKPKERGGSQPVEDEAPNSQNLARVASTEFQLRRFESAAKAYEKLLKGGGNSAHVNQRLGQCYESMGRNQDALDAYKRARTSLKSSVQSGGASDRQKAALQSVESAIKVLGGE